MTPSETVIKLGEIQAVMQPRKTETKWLIEVSAEGAAVHGAEWAVDPGYVLGVVKWHPAWKRYVFGTLGGAVLLPPHLLRSIADFCEAQATK